MRGNLGLACTVTTSGVPWKGHLEVFNWRGWTGGRYLDVFPWWVPWLSS
jgi:hypothetical protein